MLRRIERVWFWVQDMDRALKFYSDVLGLEVVHRHGDEWAELASEPVHLALHGGADGHEPGGTVVFEVEDIDEARFALELRGGRLRATRGGGGGPRALRLLRRTRTGTGSS